MRKITYVEKVNIYIYNFPLNSIRQQSNFFSSFVFYVIHVEYFKKLFLHGLKNFKESSEP